MRLTDPALQYSQDDQMKQGLPLTCAESESGEQIEATDHVSKHIKVTNDASKHMKLANGYIKRFCFYLDNIPS